MRCFLLFWILFFQVLTISSVYAAPDVRDSATCLRGNQSPAGEKFGLIVFVHGYTGNTDEYWSYSKNGQPLKYWWDFLDQDPAFADFDKCTLGYPSSRFQVNLTVQEIATDVGTRLDLVAEDYQHIVFIAHSLGGIVTRELLLQNEEISSKTRILFAIAVPTDGSKVGNIWSAFNRYDLLIKQLRDTHLGNKYLTGLQNRWINGLQDQITTHCIYETKKVHGILVVPKFSANDLCNSIKAVKADHSNIIRIPGVKLGGADGSSTFPTDFYRNSSNHSEVFDTSNLTYVLFRKAFFDHFKRIEWNINQLDKINNETPDATVVGCPPDPEKPEEWAKHAPKFDRLLADELKSISIRDRPARIININIPKDWKHNKEIAFERFFTNQYEPNLVILHLSCFQNSALDIENNATERTKDFLKFARFILEETDAKILVYSRAWRGDAFSYHIVRPLKNSFTRAEIKDRIIPFRYSFNDHFYDEKPRLENFKKKAEKAMTD